MTRTVAALALALLMAPAQAADVPVFSSSVELVRMDVSVTRDGVAVTGLEAEDFVVRDQGTPRKIEIIEGGEKRVHAVLVLDTSSSLLGAPLGHLKKAARAFVDLLHDDDSLTLLTFSDRIELRAGPDDARDHVREVIDATEARLTTSLVDAAFAAITVTDPTRGRPLVLLFSDGQDVGSWLPARRVLQAARSSEVVVHVVASRREGTDVDFLRDLATATGGQLWIAEHRELEEALPRALDEFRSRYTIQFPAGDETRTGWHEVDVRLRKGHASVRSRRGYWRQGAGPSAAEAQLLPKR